MMTLSSSKFKAIIFDMDGTMVDNMQIHKKVWKEYAKAYGKDLTEEDFNNHLSGRKNTYILPYIFGRELSNEEIKQYQEEKEALYRKEFAPHAKEIQGLTKLITEAKRNGLKVAVATTSPESNRNFIFQKLGMEDTFDTVVGDEHVTNGKPDPEIYFTAAERMQISPQECLVFEDTPAGVRAAKMAGMTVIGILSTHTKEALHEADYTVENFSQIKFT